MPFQRQKGSGWISLRTFTSTGNLRMLWGLWMANILLFLNPQAAVLCSTTTKGFFSVVLLALVKHNYQFLYVNVGCQGRISDGGVLKSSDLYHGIQSSLFNIPNPTPLPKTGDPCWDDDEYPDIPYMIVGDEAFQLANYMVKPYSASRQ